MHYRDWYDLLLGAGPGSLEHVSKLLGYADTTHRGQEHRASLHTCRVLVRGAFELKADGVKA